MALMREQPTVMAKKGVIRYLGLEYVPSPEPFVAPEHRYWTGESFDGMRIYLPVGQGYPADTPVYKHLYLQKKNGECQSYVRAPDPPVYPYIVCGSYGIGERIDFGLVNDHAGTLRLPGSAPWSIERKAGAGWEPAFSPPGTLDISFLDEGLSRQWSWDQKTKDGEQAPFGAYRARMRLANQPALQEKLAVEFRIDPGTPSVCNRPKVDYSTVSISNTLWKAPQLDAYQQAYGKQGYSTRLRDDLVSLIKFKAAVSEQDPLQLMTAIRATGVYQHGNKGLPCLAVHANYEGRPAWAIVYAIMLAENYVPPHCYIVDDKTGQVVHESAPK